MNAKKTLVVAVAVSVVLLAVAASIQQTKHNEAGRAALTGPRGKFGPTIETVLPAREASALKILDLETGRELTQPSLEHFNYDAEAIISWARSKGLDLSSSVWPNGAACVTHDMTVVAVEAKDWEQATETDLRQNPALAEGQHAPRRMLMLGDNRPDTYAFRTSEGTLGMLRLVGSTQQGRGVKVCYKLINPTTGESAVAAAKRSRVRQDL